MTDFSLPSLGGFIIKFESDGLSCLPHVLTARRILYTCFVGAIINYLYPPVPHGDKPVPTAKDIEKQENSRGGDDDSDDSNPKKKKKGSKTHKKPKYKTRLERKIWDDLRPKLTRLINLLNIIETCTCETIIARLLSEMLSISREVYQLTMWACILDANILLRFIWWQMDDIAVRMSATEELRERFFLKPKSDFIRDRKISLFDLLVSMLCLAEGDYNKEIYEYFKINFDIPTASAFSQRRAQLKPEGVEYFFEELLKVCKLLCDVTDEHKPKYPFIVYAFDGSDINVAYDESKESFVQNQGKKGYNQIHLNALYDIGSALFVKAVLQPKTKVHETMAAAAMIQAMSFSSPALITADRGYGSLNLFETIIRKENCDFLIRVRENYIKEIEALELKELDVDLHLHIITTQRNEDKERIKAGKAKYLSGVSKYGKDKKHVEWMFDSEVDMTLRVVRFQLSSGNWETIVTSLDREHYGIEEIKELYAMRWNEEGAFRTLKYDCHLSRMHCKKEEYAKQEIFAKMTLHNIVSTVINLISDTEKRAKAVARTCGYPVNDTKYEYIINRHFACMLICDFLRSHNSTCVNVPLLMLQHKSPVRKGRSFKRDMRAIGFASFLYR